MIICLYCVYDIKYRGENMKVSPVVKKYLIVAGGCVVAIILLSSVMQCSSTMDEIKKTKEKLRDASEQVDSLTQSVRELNERNKSQMREIQAMSSANQSKDSEIQELEDSVTAKRDSIELLKAQLQECHGGTASHRVRRNPVTKKRVVKKNTVSATKNDCKVADTTAQKSCGNACTVNINNGTINNYYGGKEQNKGESVKIHSSASSKVTYIFRIRSGNCK